MLTVIDKVKVLLKIDLLAQSTSEELAALAAIAEEEEWAAGTTIFRAGDPPDAMFVVLEGRIRMLREGAESATGASAIELEVGPGEAIGVWALFDDLPRALTAQTLDASRLLRIGREEFFDLLSDRASLTQGIFRTLVRRIRALAESAL